ncbi:MAG: alcohol dehydrogenase [Hyphomicrobiaceae bacterium]|jgi:alcohol dehydrogenase
MPNVKVCVKDGDGKVALVDMDVADPGPGQALIRTEVTTICGSDIHMLDDFPEIPAGLPMGHEAIGVVEAIGEGVVRLKVGDRIAAACLTSCGTCARCTGGDPQVCIDHGAPLNLLFGAQAEAFLLNGADYSSAVVPKTADARAVLFATDVMSTGFAAIERAGVTPGDSVAIFAQGPVGLCATAGAKFHGAEQIFAVESIPERVALAKSLGATEVLDPATAVEEILARTNGLGVDVAVEALGKQQTLTNCFAVARMGGTVSSVGVYGSQESVTVPTSGGFYHRNFITTLCPVGTERLTYLIDLCDSGKVDLTGLLSHKMPLADIAKAYDMFRGRKDGMIKPALS